GPARSRRGRLQHVPGEPAADAGLRRRRRGHDCTGRRRRPDRHFDHRGQLTAVPVPIPCAHEKEAEHVVEETLFEAEEKMERAVEFAKEELATIRTGRATPAMFSRILVDYYGAPTPVTQMSTIAIPEPRMVIIKPHDPSQLRAME